MICCSGTRGCKWFEHVGLTTTPIALTLHERAVADLAAKAIDNYSCNVTRANPHQHQSVGAAGRAARTLKKGRSCSDLCSS